MSAARPRSPTPTVSWIPATCWSSAATAIISPAARGGIINVGGLKVHPEEVEGVINRHPQVRMSLVHPRKSPITGAIVVAEVVLREEGAPERIGTLRGEILDLCRARLAQHKVPAMIRFVPALSVAASGKLERPHA